MIDVDVMQDASEIVHYDNPKIPLYIRNNLLSSYPDMRALCHWHEDIELIYILDGEMYYDVNEHKILLEKGDSIVINSKQMHYGYSHYKKECSFLCILFSPCIFKNHSYIFEQYVKPIIDNQNIEYLFLKNNFEVRDIQIKILQLKEEGKDCFEFEIISKLFHLWSIIYRICKKKNIICNNKIQPNDLLIQKKMVSYIYEHYSESVSLDQIASAGNVSRSKCCIIFKKYLKQSPIHFLNSYRLEVSCNLLKNTDENISNIAFSCGFNHLSYYSKIFYKKYNCSPSTFCCKNRS